MQDAHCMQCRRVWSHDVLRQNFPAAWLNGDYKRHREAILVEREKQLLPESQRMVANYRNAKRLRSGLSEKLELFRNLKQQCQTLNREIWNDRYRAERLEAGGYQGYDNVSDIQRNRVEFSAPCPAGDCRGFLGADMVCGTCAVKACTSCGVLLGDTHECKEDDKASFKSIKKDTKPCPKCHIPTYRVSGCSQMWCVGCQTPWDWNTGAVVEGVIHNPHYFQYLRERSANGEIPRQPGDGGPNRVDCDRRRFPSGWDMSRKIRDDTVKKFPEQTKEYDTKKTMSCPLYKEDVDLQISMTNTMRKLIHISEVEVPHLRNRYRNTDNADLRLKYLLNEITEAELKTQLQRREKKREKDVAVRDIYQMLCDTGRDVLWGFMDDSRTMAATVTELNALKKYANEHLKKIKDQFKMSVQFV
jgi:hypothetical protein